MPILFTCALLFCWYSDSQLPLNLLYWNWSCKSALILLDDGFRKLFSLVLSWGGMVTNSMPPNRSQQNACNCTPGQYLSTNLPYEKPAIPRSREVTPIYLIVCCGALSLIVPHTKSPSHRYHYRATKQGSIR